MTVATSLGGQTPNFQNNLQGRIFRTRMLRDKIGPDDPTYHLLMLEAKRDVFSIFDDFLTVLDNTGQTEIFWTPVGGGAGTAPDQLTGTGDVNGVIDFPTTGSNDADSHIISEAVFTADHRPVSLFRMQINSTIAATKFELGFAGADPGAGENAGQVLVKATPTSTGVDYAVIVYDTDDDTSVDLQTDGGDSAVASVVSSPVFTGTDSTFVTQTWYDFMIAVNEQGEVRFWVDSTFRGVIRGTSANDTGPDIDLETLSIWAFCQSRDGTQSLMYLDYVLAWQERVRLPRAVA